jgi:hypothetical protein
MSEIVVTSKTAFQFNEYIGARDRRTELFHGPSGPHWLRVDPLPSLGFVRIGEQGFHAVDDGVHLLKLLFLRQLVSDTERTDWPEAGSRESTTYKL